MKPATKSAVARDTRVAGGADGPGSLTLPYAELLSLRCIPLSDSWARREMQICYREDAVPTVAVRLFIAHLRKDGRPE